MKPIVLLIEDDPKQTKTIVDALKKVFPDVEDILTLTDEDSALICIRELKKGPYFVVSGVMMPWFNSETRRRQFFTTPPYGFSNDSWRSAGTRLWKEFRKMFPTVPWIYFTILDAKTIDFDANTDLYTGYVQKEGPLNPLIEEIRELLSIDDPLEGTDEEISERLWTDPEMRAKLLAGLATPLEECWRMPDSVP